ncbi:MAG TPA: Gfo/Idh/MocA family oxidoreductase [Candidatus Hydrogenedentes bacterium]|nr:Gfo/Idh/MocA family oxidoreductase [Candidatus Hydrogenedentota bacterium]HPC16267.1 Gfo/Idh/MocA family oxidoreductase [Candidatus Hydrogenedentota bacterium]HRT21649.1 Gfo/Idh/MocA family oxidoreductase [Candidatus Hydrogenedentota bacterium]HRT66901.1 Gfo/Idh/MocA family oxidoreductase [Candidatus Hydrogenedentota bacterium]
MTVANQSLSRRSFLSVVASGAAAAGCATRVNTAQVVPGVLSPNEKLNIAAVGVGGMGGANLKACAAENIVALCDVDDAYAANTFAAYPQARRYKDFRKMFDAEANNIDAVIIATPDHTHAVIAMAAMRLGKHVYCQKPLAHSLYEVRRLTETARECKVQTQMGNQGHSSDEIRRVKEWIADGAIGPVREVHAWSDRPVGGDPWSTFPIMKRPADTPAVPESLDWDLWLGPSPYRPYHPIYHPMQWRGWYAFGTGALGDMGCHILDPAFWALDLRHPTSVEATTTHWEKEVSDETYPRACIVRYEFPARGKMPPVRLTWYDGRLKPPFPRDFDPRQRFDSNGALLVGDKGTILHGSHGAGNPLLLPKKLRQSYKQPEETIPRVKGEAHEHDWIRACKDGKPASSSFEYGGALTEMVLLGVLAMRLPDRRLLWDGAAMRFTNDAEANAFINPPYRDGWTLE